jgi:hypothetical protein
LNEQEFRLSQLKGSFSLLNEAIRDQGPLDEVERVLLKTFKTAINYSSRGLISAHLLAA